MVGIVDSFLKEATQETKQAKEVVNAAAPFPMDDVEKTSDEITFTGHHLFPIRLGILSNAAEKSGDELGVLIKNTMKIKDHPDINFSVEEVVSGMKLKEPIHSYNSFSAEPNSTNTIIAIGWNGGGGEPPNLMVYNPMAWNQWECVTFDIFDVVFIEASALWSIHSPNSPINVYRLTPVKVED